MKKKIVFSVMALVVLATVLGFVKKRRSTSSDEFVPVPFDKATIEVKIRATGTVQSQNRLEVKPPTSGRMEEILVAEGQRVSKGRVLGWMSSAERVSLLDAARANGAEELTRWKEIYKATPILSPMAGNVILVGVKTGQTILGSDVVFVLSDRLIVQAVVDETDIARVSRGQTAGIVLDAYPTRSIEGEVTRVAFDAKTVNNVTTYQVDVLPRVAPDFMKSGMTANVNFLVDRKVEAPSLPAEAVISRDGRHFVWVSTNVDGKPLREEREIRTGLSDGKRIEILEGISPGDRIVSRTWRLPREEGAGANPFMPSFAKRPPKPGGTNGTP